MEEELTAAEVLAKLEEAWLNEKQAPELLEPKMEVQGESQNKTKCWNFIERWRRNSTLIIFKITKKNNFNLIQ